MCEALSDLMKDQIQEANEKAVYIEMIAAIKSAMKSHGLDATSAMEGQGIPEADQIRCAVRL